MSYDSPPLPTSEIVSFLREHVPDVGLTAQDFKTPQKERWQQIFMALVCNITGCSPDNIYQPTLSAREQLEYPELHDYSTNLINLVIVLMRVGEACCIQISLIDIIKPSPKRLNKICSAIVNFMRLQSDRLEAYDRIKQEDNVLKEHSNALQKENDDIQQKINMILAERAEQKPYAKQLEDQIEAFQQELTEMKKAAAICEKQTADVKSSISQKKSANARVVEQIAELRQEEASLDNQIVVSPERMKTEMITLQSAIDNMRAERDDRMQQLMNWNAKKDSMQAMAADCDDALRLINTIKEKIDKEKDMKAEIRKLQDEGIAVVQENIQTFISREQQMRRQLSTREDRISKIQMQHKNKITNIEQSLEETQEQKEAVSSKQERRDVEYQELLESKQMLTKGAIAKRQQHEQSMELLSQKFSTMKETLDEYHVNIVQSLSKVRQGVPTQ